MFAQMIAKQKNWSADLCALQLDMWAIEHIVLSI